jgi:hypothetical protein
MPRGRGRDLAASDARVGDTPGGDGVGPSQRFGDAFDGNGGEAVLLSERVPFGGRRDRRSRAGVGGDGEDREPVAQLGRDQADDE